MALWMSFIPEPSIAFVGVCPLVKQVNASSKTAVSIIFILKTASIVAHNVQGLPQAVELNDTSLPAVRQAAEPHNKYISI